MKLRFYCGDCANYSCCNNRHDKQGKICDSFKVGWRFYEISRFAIMIAPKPYEHIHSSYDVEIENQFDEFAAEPITLTLNSKENV